LLLDGRTDEVGEEAMNKRHHARADLMLSAVLAVIAVVYAIESFDLPETSPNQADIGPRAYPLLILVLMVLTTALLMLKSLRSFSSSARPEVGSEPESRADRHTMLFQLVSMALVVVSSVVYLELMIPLGFIVATALFLAVQVAIIGGWRRYGGRRMFIPIVFACLTSVAIYMLFADSLGVPLPQGIFSL
jgi:putative tricarboxylic transport membrane protein